MEAVSLHGSNRLYLELLERMFYAALTRTASMSGVVPRVAAMGLKKGENIVCE